jgi:mRNA interferase MazF
MEALMKGDIVVVPLPFTDFSGSQRRPAVVCATLTGDDIILCQVTSAARADDYAVSISGHDLARGNLRTESKARPNKLFTTYKGIISYKLGTLQKTKMMEIEEKIINIFRER